MMVPPIYEEIAIAEPLDQVFEAFLDRPHAIFLDSSLEHPLMGRYSYIAADPFLVLKAKGNRITMLTGGSRCEWRGDPFRELQRLLREYPAPAIPGLPPFQGGAVGYLGYDLAHHLEELPRRAVDDLSLPDLYMGFYNCILAHDHLQGRSWIIATPYPDEGNGRARHRLREVKERIARREMLSTVCLEGDLNGARHKGSDRGTIRTLVPKKASPASGSDSPGLSCNFTHDRYIEAVRRAKEYILAGDIFQVCLSQRFDARLTKPAWNLYRRLRRVSPVPYGAFLNFEGFAVASASPELFLRVEGRRVVTRPIKGTRPRGRTEEEDRALAQELRSSAKDQAENVMIVDLLRNDLGRVCRIGSICVPDLLALESYSTVYHLVSTVTGELAEGYDTVDLLRACFPGGSVTGCPKIRAMEIIDELEPTCRGIYCGSIGYLGFNGNMDTSIVIRTIIILRGRAYIQVGGAVVADSDPEAEYQETLDKARAAMTALEVW